MIHLASCTISNYDVCLSVPAIFKYILHGGMHSALLLSKLTAYELVQKSCVAALTWHWSQAHQPCCLHFPSGLIYTNMLQKDTASRSICWGSSRNDHWPLKINDLLTSVSNSTCRGNTMLIHPPKKDGLCNLCVMDCARFNYDQTENLHAYLF